MKPVVFFVVLAVLASSCSKKKQEEPSTTRGSLTLISAEPYAELMKQEAEEFARVYAEVTTSVSSASTREAIVYLLNDSVKTVCVDRPLNEEERRVAAQASIKVTENKIAEDALMVVIQQQNPMKNISFQSLKNIVSGAAESWKQIPESRWEGGIELVLTGKNSGAYELLQRRFFSLSKPLTPTVVVGTQRECVQYVTTHPRAITFVSVTSIHSLPNVVRVLGIDSLGTTEEEKFIKPSQMAIYQSRYPLHFSVYLYNAERKAGIGVGFTSFVTTTVGQKIVQNAGLAPASIPNRIIQLNAE